MQSDPSSLGRVWRRLLQGFAIQPDPGTGKTTPELQVMAGLYLLILAAYLLGMRGNALSTDAVAVYQVTRSIVQEGDLSIDPINDTVLGPDGQTYSVFGLAQSIFSLPLYMVGAAVDRYSTPALQTYFTGTIVDLWRGEVPQFFVSTFNQLVSPLIAVVLYLFARRMNISRRHALLTSLIFALGTLAWSQANEYYQHPLETLWLLLAIYILFAHRSELRERHAWFAGFFMALGLLTRINLLVSTPLLAIYLWHLAAKTSETGLSSQRWRLLQGFSLPVVLAFTVVLYLNQMRFGNMLVFNPVYARFGLASPIWTGLYGYFFSLGRSIFLYSPPLLAALTAWPSFWKRFRAEAFLFGGIFVVYLATYAFSVNWAGGWSWGPRYFLPIVALCILPLAYCWRTKTQTWLALGLALLGVFMQILGVVVNYSYIHGDWAGLGFTYPGQEYLFLPAFSPPVMHLRALLEGRHLDTWLLGVYQRSGPLVFVVSLIPILIMLVTAVTFLRSAIGRRNA